jgi:hypothetical protein
MYFRPLKIVFLVRDDEEIKMLRNYMCTSHVFKGTVARVFDPRFFSSINPTYDPDSRAKAISHMARIRQDNRFESRQNRFQRGQ